MASSPGYATRSTAVELPSGRESRLKPPFFVTDRAALAGPRIVLDGQEGRHATTVRRLVPGEQAYLTYSSTGGPAPGTAAKSASSSRYRRMSWFVTSRCPLAVW